MKRVIYTSDKYVGVQDSETFRVENLTWGEYRHMQSKIRSRKRYWSYEDDEYRIVEGRQYIEITFKKFGEKRTIYRSINGLCCNGSVLHTRMVTPSFAYINSKGNVKIICGKSIVSVMCYKNGYVMCVNRYTNKKLWDRNADNLNTSNKRK